MEDKDGALARRKEDSRAAARAAEGAVAAAGSADAARASRGPCMDWWGFAASSTGGAITVDGCFSEVPVVEAAGPLDVPPRGSCVAVSADTAATSDVDTAALDADDAAAEAVAGCAVGPGAIAASAVRGGAVPAGAGSAGDPSAGAALAAAIAAAGTAEDSSSIPTEGEVGEACLVMLK